MSNNASNTARHPLFARLWPWLARGLDRQGGVSHRRRMLEGLDGRVIEIGAGDGRNLDHYPSTVTEVLAVEPEPHLRQLAGQRASQLDLRVRVVDGLAERLPTDDNAFDAAVVSLTLCSVADQAAALAEIRRVLRPGGRLRFLEHVAADSTTYRRVQRALDAAFWPRIAGGCHTARTTGASIEESGLHITWLEQLQFPDSALPTPTSPHILGEAKAP